MRSRYHIGYEELASAIQIIELDRAFPKDDFVPDLYGSVKSWELSIDRLGGGR